MSTTAIEQTTVPPKLGSLPTHVIWANDESTDHYVVSPSPHHSRYFDRTRASSSYSDAATARSYSSSSERTNSDPAQRAFRLERNLRYLKIQHQKMLSDLYLEIESLKSRNRELQFQQAFGLPLIDEKIVEPEDDIQNNKDCIVITKEFTSTASQTEPRHSSTRLQHMEDELHRLRFALEDAETRNSCLNSLVTQLKRSHIKLKSAESSVSRIHLNSNPTNGSAQKSLEKYSNNTIKIEEYEKLIRLLRKENVEQKKELLHIRSSLSHYLTTNDKDNSADSVRKSHKLPRIPVTRESSKVHHENKNSIELPPLHPKSHRSYSSKASTPLYTREGHRHSVDELRKDSRT